MKARLPCTPRALRISFTPGSLVTEGLIAPSGCGVKTLSSSSQSTRVLDTVCSSAARNRTFVITYCAVSAYEWTWK